MKIVTPFSALLSVYDPLRSGSERTLDSMRLALCRSLASDKTQRLAQMFCQRSTRDVEIPGPTIHRTVADPAYLRLEGRDRGVDTGDIGPLRGEIGVDLARYCPR